MVLISGPDDDGPSDDSISREDLTGCRLIVSQRGSLMRALVDDVLASGIEVSIVAEIGVLGSAEPTVAVHLDVVSLESQALVLISGPDDDGPTEDSIFA